MRGSTIASLLLVLTSVYGENSVHGQNNRESSAETRLSHDALPQANVMRFAMEEQYPSVLDPVWSLWFIVSQLYHAQVNDTFPTVSFPLRITPASDGPYKLHPCKRTDLAKCMYHGTLPLKRVLAASG